MPKKKDVNKKSARADNESNKTAENQTGQTSESGIVMRTRPVPIPVIRPSDFHASINKWFDDLREALEERYFNPWLPASALLDLKQPSMDIIDKGDKFVIHADMPGIPKENIEINVTPSQIEISGQYEQNKDSSEDRFVRQERIRSQFYRAQSLPDEINTEKVEARMNNGVLEIHLPKKEPTPPEKKSRVPVK